MPNIRLIMLKIARWRKLPVAKGQDCKSRRCPWGLAFEIPQQFANKGATVSICSRSMRRAENCASRIEGKTYPEILDVTNVQSLAEYMRHVADRHRHRHIDILINNAGYLFDRMIWNKRFHQVAEEDLEKVVDVDLKGTFGLSQVAISFMIKNIRSAREAVGPIISIASTLTIAGHRVDPLHTITKYGVIAITENIAKDYSDKSIQAYTLSLVSVYTQATFASMTLAERKKVSMENSMKRLGDPREVATIAASVANYDVAFATGDTIVIDGGTVML
jgi:3-oxoacyl-[acyl-carrier protein] reductase